HRGHLPSFPTRRSSDLFVATVYDPLSRKKVWLTASSLDEARQLKRREEEAKRRRRRVGRKPVTCDEFAANWTRLYPRPAETTNRDRKSTRLNSSHVKIS